MKFSYPIKYGRTDGRSIWLEKEIVDMLMRWEVVTRSGAWYYVAEDFATTLKENGFEAPEKFQGENAIFEFVESSPKLVKFLHKYFVDIISSKPNEV